MVGVVAIGARDPREHVLERLAGQEIAVLHGGLAEFGEERVARAVHDDILDHLEGGLFRFRLRARVFARGRARIGRIDCFHLFGGF